MLKIKRMFNIFETSNEFITATLKNVLALHRNNTPLDGNSDCKRAYFAGRTLFLDIKDKNYNTDAITLSHTTECVGFFSGGVRRLLTIEQLRLLETLMKEMNIQHEPKWIN
jgi:hypothetical protein